MRRIDARHAVVDIQNRAELSAEPGNLPLQSPFSTFEGLLDLLRVGFLLAQDLDTYALHEELTTPCRTNGRHD